MAIIPGFFEIWNSNLFIFFKDCFIPLSKIHLSCNCNVGISNLTCTSGDLLWFLLMTLAQKSPLLCRKKACSPWHFPGQVNNCRVSKTALKAIGCGNSIAIKTVISLVAAFQLLSKNRTLNLFVNVKPAETALKQIHDRATVISACHFKIWHVCCSSQCGCSVAVNCIVTAKGNTWYL